MLPALLVVAYVTVAERKTMASMQRRLGPNAVGYYGLLQAFADALKLIGGVRKRGCPVKQIGSAVNIWIIRDHENYTNLTAKELGKLYVGFWTGKEKGPN